MGFCKFNIRQTDMAKCSPLVIRISKLYTLAHFVISHRTENLFTSIIHYFDRFFMGHLYVM